MATTATQQPTAENTPPYLAFPTLQSAIDNLRTHGLPDPIDKTTWDSRSGSDQTQIFAAFRFFGLLDSGSHPTPTLRSLVEEKPNTPAEKAILRGLLEAGYRALLKKIDLSTATPGQLEEAIGDYQLKGSARDRAVRFFLKASSYCDMKLSTRLTRNLRARAAGSSTTNSTADENGDESPAAAPTPSTGKRRRKTRGTSSPAGAGNTANEKTLGTAMKTVALPQVKGTLTISGTFNAFGLSGDERKLVYDIIDMMNAFETKAGA
jgi:hypothetical protein